MSVINGIDYDNLAHLAKTSRVPFHTLCLRAEKGLPLESGVPEDEEWISYWSVSQILNMKHNTLFGAMTHVCKELDYFGIEWKTRSQNSSVKEGKRGCGILFKRADIIVLNNIRVGAKLSLISALKVYQAMELGRI